jgi:hypothetical protein
MYDVDLKSVCPRLNFDADNSGEVKFSRDGVAEELLPLVSHYGDGMDFEKPVNIHSSHLMEDTGADTQRVSYTELLNGDFGNPISVGLNYVYL